MARDVTAKMASLVVEENLKRREQLVEGATEFLQQELDLAKQELETKEKAISQFKTRHMGELPEQMEANLRALDRLQNEKASTTDSVNVLNGRLDNVEKAIREFQSGDSSSATIVTPGQKRMSRRFEHLRELEHRLAALSAQYKETYPDIVHLKEEIRKLQSAPEEQSEQFLDSAVPSGDSKKTAPILDPYLAELFKQRNEIKNELMTQKQKQARISSQISEYEGRVERIPAKEQQLMILVRDYENLQKNYQSLLEKQLNATISENLERRQKGEQFRILDPAFLPRTPESPNELLIMLAGLAGGCLLGYGGAFWLDYARGVFRRPEDVESHLGLPVIATIPSFSCVTSGLGTLSSRALLTGPESARPFVSRYLSYRGGIDEAQPGKRLKRSYAAPSKGLSPRLHMICKWASASLIAEQYRVAATRLILMKPIEHAVTLVTSSVMGEGKTTSAVNLAYVLAHDLRKSTLLIDCDLKRPKVHDYTETPPTPGLVELLSGNVPVDGCLHHYGDIPLWILPVGSVRVRPSGLSVLQDLKKLLPQLQTRFDHIILDAPPVLPLADVNALTGLADTLVFVIKAGFTEQHIVKNALKSMGDIGNAAAIFTQVEMEYAPYFSYAAPYSNEDIGIGT